MLLFRAILYMIFTLLAAPIESWAYYLNGTGFGRDDFLVYPFTGGLLYLVAIILFAESVFRMFSHFDRLEFRPTRSQLDLAGQFHCCLVPGRCDGRRIFRH